mmetsp:Transcript_50161/g.95828  ORF Transcript_50161/g.95828 Transcript_50161/m.95828 type:complete len:184 (+) Transcript_50161:158-709(+)
MTRGAITLVMAIVFMTCNTVVEGSSKVAVRQVTGGRAEFLALTLVEMRCPSQYIKMVHTINFATAGRRLLEDEEEETFSGSVRRMLLGKPAAKKPTVGLHEFRASSRAQAVAHAHEVCTGAPDDKGPAIFFPLHLDVDDQAFVAQPADGTAAGTNNAASPGVPNVAAGLQNAANMAGAGGVGK